MNINILVAFYSRMGSTEALALAIAEGVTAAGATVRRRRARELVAPAVLETVAGWTSSANRMNAAYPPPSEADAEWADALIFGNTDSIWIQ